MSNEIPPGPPFPTCPKGRERWNGKMRPLIFYFLFLSKLPFCLLLTFPINEGIKVNNTFSSFHFSAFASQTNIFLFFFLLLPTSKHMLNISPSSFLFISLPPFATKHSVSLLFFSLYVLDFIENFNYLCIIS